MGRLRVQVQQMLVSFPVTNGKISQDHCGCALGNAWFPPTVMLADVVKVKYFWRTTLVTEEILTRIHTSFQKFA